MRPPPASESRMKLKPLTVADIAALAACYRDIDAAAKAGNDGPMMAVAFGQLAGVLDRINLGKRPKAFSDMTLPEFLRAVARVVPDIIAANQAQFADFDASAADFAEALSSLDVATAKR